jgi:cobalt/nickel transport system permease protein
MRSVAIVSAATLSGVALICAVAGAIAQPPNEPAVASNKAADPPRWEGVDKTVIEKFAADAGHAAREPYINTEQGDLLLFLFLLAGAVGGFVAGYAFRGLFPPRGTR